MGGLCEAMSEFIFKLVCQLISQSFSGLQFNFPHLDYTMYILDLLCIFFVGLLAFVGELFT